MNITGLMYGRRVIDWEGTMNFLDENNGLSATIAFTPPPKFFQKFKEATDIFRGELKKDEQILHKIFGSPIDKLIFDSEV
jgi:hypothetical protein